MQWTDEGQDARMRAMNGYADGACGCCHEVLDLQFGNSRSFKWHWCMCMHWRFSN